MVLEAHPNAAPWICENFSLPEIELLLGQTVELRRDSKEREEELMDEEREIWWEENQGKTLRFAGVGGMVDVSLSDFAWDDEEEDELVMLKSACPRD